MTDKQIIIDSIDVSGCVCFSNWHVVMTGQGLVINEIENSCTTKQKPCTDIKDCIFKKLTKQLQAKEQECEELKKIINEAKNSKLDLNSFFAIEATVGEYQLELDQLKAENEGLKKNYFTVIQQRNKAEKTLTEIKEIAEICKCHNTDGCYECKYFDNCEVEDEEIPTRDVCKLILQIISECEGKRPTGDRANG